MFLKNTTILQELVETADSPMDKVFIMFKDNMTECNECLP